MDLRETLMELEERFWTGGAGFYREHLLEDALMALPEPAGIMDREAIVETIASAPRWKTVEFEDIRVLRPGPEVAILIYEAKARRHDEERSYFAIVSSTYARRNGAWRLTFHQQTPSRSSS